MSTEAEKGNYSFGLKELVRDFPVGDTDKCRRELFLGLAEGVDFYGRYTLGAGSRVDFVREWSRFFDISDDSRAQYALFLSGAGVEGITFLLENAEYDDEKEAYTIDPKKALKDKETVVADFEKFGRKDIPEFYFDKRSIDFKQQNDIFRQFSLTPHELRAGLVLAAVDELEELIPRLTDTIPMKSKSEYLDLMNLQRGRHVGEGKKFDSARVDKLLSLCKNAFAATSGGSSPQTTI